MQHRHILEVHCHGFVSGLGRQGHGFIEESKKGRKSKFARQLRSGSSSDFERGGQRHKVT